VEILAVWINDSLDCDLLNLLSQIVPPGSHFSKRRHNLASMFGVDGVQAIEDTIAMGVEWDENKNRLNIQKHGISFREAALIFQGPTLEKVDDRRDYGEERIIALGVANRRILSVVYTMRGNNRRIISTL
jgi:hypothetical protein